MNGRIYDPTLGRFLQADPFIQAPSNSQSYNRYSYVLNNPLSYTDPSGYFFSGLAKKVGRKFIRSAVKIFGAKAVNIVGTFVATYFGNAYGAALWTYEFNRAMGVSSSGALRAGATAYFTASAFQAIGSYYNNASAAGAGSGLYEFGGNYLTAGQIAGQISSHAIVGGVSSSLNGGKFGHGFFAAGVTKGLGTSVNDTYTLGPVSGTVSSMVIGGTASVISGGKFANGAITAAYQSLLNYYGKGAIESIKDFFTRAPNYSRTTYQTAEGVMAEGSRAKSVSHYNETTPDEIANSLAAVSTITGIGGVGFKILSMAYKSLGIASYGFGQAALGSSVGAVGFDMLDGSLRSDVALGAIYNGSVKGVSYISPQVGYVADLSGAVVGISDYVTKR